MIRRFHSRLAALLIALVVMGFGRAGVRAPLAFTGTVTLPTGTTAAVSGTTTIAAGWNHSLALKSDGTVLPWSLNTGGQATVPAGLAGVIRIAAGDTYTPALKTART